MTLSLYLWVMQCSTSPHCRLVVHCDLSQLENHHLTSYQILFHASVIFLGFPVTVAAQNSDQNNNYNNKDNKKIKCLMKQGDSLINEWTNNGLTLIKRIWVLSLWHDEHFIFILFSTVIEQNVHSFIIYNRSMTSKIKFTDFHIFFTSYFNTTNIFPRYNS